MRASPNLTWSPLRRLLDSCLSLTNDGLRRVNHLVLKILQGFLRRSSFQAAAVQEDPGNLDDTDTSEEEVNSSEPDWNLVRSSLGVFVKMNKTYKMLRGLMIKHQRVQIAPVAISAAFWVRESFSAGRPKSEIPAMTKAHCFRQKLVLAIWLNPVFRNV